MEITKLHIVQYNITHYHYRTTTNLIFLQRLILQQSRPKFILILFLLHNMHLYTSGHYLECRSLGIYWLKEGDIYLIIFIVGLSLKFECGVFQGDGFIFYICAKMKNENIVKRERERETSFVLDI